MNFLATIGKKFLFWTYPRTSWQWDVLCVLILIFIFLTPKSWFANTAYRPNEAAQSTVAVGVDVLGNQLDRTEIERRARQRASRPNGQVNADSEVKDSSGKVIA